MERNFTIEHAETGSENWDERDCGGGDSGSCEFVSDGCFALLEDYVRLLLKTLCLGEMGLPLDPIWY